MTPTNRLAEFTVGLNSADVPARIRERTRLVVADTLGAVVGGADDPAFESLAGAWANPPGVLVPGTTVRARPDHAAYLTGTAGTALELDEGHRFAGGHPAVHVVPAALAEGADRGVDAETFEMAVVAGYEVAATVARAMQPLREGYHPHGVWGGVGAAAAVARLRGYDTETTADALAIAANGAQHTRFAAATEGATVRNTYAGGSNRAGITAADVAAAGFTGLEDGVVRHLDLAAADGVDPTTLTDIGNRWELDDGYFKRHAACRYTHPAIEAALELGDHVTVPEIDTVTVGTYPAAARLDDPVPDSPLAAKFSVPYAVAAAFVLGHADKTAFDVANTPAAVADLARQVSVTVDGDIATRAPAARGARVTVERHDGTTVDALVERAKGDAKRPYTTDELREKFDVLTAPRLGESVASDLWTAATAGAPPETLLEHTAVEDD